ncbi:MAG: exodeoxyribonuclease VII small subunit [Lachnospiraceae bacterium]|nr:exodeoxyribonuclease VII small subunit [Lachnospiraceae bacterium]
MAEENKLTIEESLEKLDEIVSRMEDPEISLEDSFKLYENGIQKLKECSEMIDAVEKQVMKLTEDGGLTPLDE